MACYHPISAWQRGDGMVVFAELGDIRRALFLPCGQCVGCRLERSRQWAVRCLHEASLHDANCFLTLTYDDDHLPTSGSLQYSDFQKFLKRVRARFSRARVRYYMCGEYGDITLRPHYHACLFGFNFPDCRRLYRSTGGTPIFSSQLLEDLWPLGHSSVGAVTFESAAYVARYVMKKITGQAARDHYAVVDSSTGEISWRSPEFNHMSLKPGIGANWISSFRSDVYPAGEVVVRGKKARAPRYYDEHFKRWDPEGYEAMKFGHELEAKAQVGNNTDARLKVRETVARARIAQFRNREVDDGG